MNEIRFNETAHVKCLDCTLLSNSGSAQLCRAEAQLHVGKNKRHRAYVERTTYNVFTNQPLGIKSALDEATRLPDIE